MMDLITPTKLRELHKKESTESIAKVINAALCEKGAYQQLLNDNEIKVYVSRFNNCEGCVTAGEVKEALKLFRGWETKYVHEQRESDYVSFKPLQEHTNMGR